MRQVMPELTLIKTAKLRATIKGPPEIIAWYGTKEGAKHEIIVYTYNKRFFTTYKKHLNSSYCLISYVSIHGSNNGIKKTVSLKGLKQ